MFGIESPSLTEVLLAFIAIVVPLSTLLVAWLKQRAEDKRTLRADAVLNLQAIVDRLEAQLKRQDANATLQQDAINRLRTLLERCQLNDVRLRGYIQLLANSLMRALGSLRAANIPCEDMGNLPPMPVCEPTDIDEAEFIHRTTAQDAQVMAALNAEALKAAQTAKPPEGKS